MFRTILHIDMNNFYASVECLYNPQLRGRPMAVAGDPAARHGIVLAKNYPAKACGVQTGDPLWIAKQKCPNIVFTPPHYDRYMRFSQIAQEIYSEYTDQVESYGLDECWLDVTGSIGLFGDGKTIADELRRRIRQELGVTASVGVSYNKIFAKLGSDMKKPDATTVITSDRFKEIVWPMPVNDLLYVGQATYQKLKRYYIKTIGDLAAADQRFLQHLLGKHGLMLWHFANGLDTSPVSNIGAKSMIQSIGNSTTAPRDLITDEDIKITLYVLCESVSARMRELGCRCTVVEVGVRDAQLRSFTRQQKLTAPSCSSEELARTAFSLFRESYRWQCPVRSVGVRGAGLVPMDQCVQLSLSPEDQRREKWERIDAAVDRLRSRYGYHCVRRAAVTADPLLGRINPKDDHTVHPLGYFRG